jgi:cytoskeleton protein RodZ
MISGIIIVQKIVSKREAELKTVTPHVITGNDAPVDISAPVTQSSPAAEPVATPAPTATPSPSPTPTPAASAAPAPKAAASVAPVPTPTPVAKTVVKPTPTPTPAPSAKPSPSPTPSPTPAAEAVVPNVPQTVIVEALDSVTLKISIDGKAAQEVNMAADQIQTFKAKGKIRLSTSNGGAISIIHNGRELGVPGNLGQPKALSFP